MHRYRGDEWALFGAAPGLVAELRREAIVVGVNQANSAGFGAAETMLAREVVEYVDGMRSTTRTAAGRALVGHSLGGMAASPT